MSILLATSTKHFYESAATTRQWVECRNLQELSPLSDGSDSLFLIKNKKFVYFLVLLKRNEIDPGVRWRTGR